jgi:hypothetical protein
MENYIKEKSAKLFRLNNCTEYINVILQKEKNYNTRNRICEIRLAIPANDPIVKLRSELLRSLFCGQCTFYKR